MFIRFCLATSIWAIRFSRYSFCRPVWENEVDADAYTESASLTATERLAETLWAREVSTEFTIDAEALADAEADAAESDRDASSDSSASCASEAEAEADSAALSERAVETLARALSEASDALSLAWALATCDVETLPFAESLWDAASCWELSLAAGAALAAAAVRLGASLISCD